MVFFSSFKRGGDDKRIKYLPINGDEGMNRNPPPLLQVMGYC